MQLPPTYELRCHPFTLYLLPLQVTVTTVGYGDIAPQTILGQVIASVIMMTGYGIIAVGAATFHSTAASVQLEVQRGTAKPRSTNTRACLACGAEGHDDDAAYCKYCGAQLRARVAAAAGAANRSRACGKGPRFNSVSTLDDL